MNLVFGEGVKIGEAIEAYAYIVVTGYIKGRFFSVNFLKAWYDKEWKGEILELVQIKTLTQGWFSLRFQTTKDERKLLSKDHNIDFAPKILKK